MRLVSELPGRAPASSDTWDWLKYSGWRDEIWQLVSDFADTRVKEIFVAHPPEYVVSDDLSWLDDLVWAAHERNVDSKSLLAERLSGRFKTIRAIHGGRPEDVGAYYKHGIRPLAPDAMHDRARQVFLSGEFPELNETILAEAIAAVGTDVREGRVYFEANEVLLLKHCGHYMLYGSEYLVAIAAHLGRRRDYRQKLKCYGVPTVFVCDVPLALMSPGTISEFAGIALQMIFEELLEGRNDEPHLWRGAGFCTFEPLPPEHIVGHYHPTDLRDPIAQ